MKPKGSVCHHQVDQPVRALGEETEKEVKKPFKNIMNENFQNLMKEIN